ncbi:MAG: HlyU family transcriptional regulator [Alphaproteobacteria bacterium]|nr:HlyU family transcriptional regulator [Alphaproteobacteria bacterium]
MINQFSKFLNRLFSSKSKPSFTPSGHSSISYKEYSVRADPELQGNQWITAGIISKELNGSIKEYRFVRGDFHASRESANEFSISKACQIIDLEGEKIFE